MRTIGLPSAVGDASTRQCIHILNSCINIAAAEESLSNEARVTIGRQDSDVVVVSYPCPSPCPSPCSCPCPSPCPSPCPCPCPCPPDFSRFASSSFSTSSSFPPCLSSQIIQSSLAAPPAVAYEDLGHSRRRWSTMYLAIWSDSDNDDDDDDDDESSGKLFLFISVSFII